MTLTVVCIPYSFYITRKTAAAASRNSLNTIIIIIIICRRTYMLVPIRILDVDIILWLHLCRRGCVKVVPVWNLLASRKKNLRQTSLGEKKRIKFFSNVVIRDWFSLLTRAEKSLLFRSRSGSTPKICYVLCACVHIWLLYVGTWYVYNFVYDSRWGIGNRYIIIYNNIIMMYSSILYGLHRAIERYLLFKTRGQSFAPWPQIVIAIRLS